MDFHARAQNALERGSPARAMILLVEGLRRDPGREDALDLLLFIYTTHILRPGLESDVLKALEPQRERPALLRFTLDELERFEKGEMARALWQDAEERGFEIAAPMAPPQEPEEFEEPSKTIPESVEPEEAAASEREGGDRDGDGEARVEREQGGEDRQVEVPAKLASSGAKKGRGRPRIVFFLVILLLVGALVGGLTLIWRHKKVASRVAALDGAMSVLDPLSPQLVYDQLDQLSHSPGGRKDLEILERRQFIEVLVALERGQEAQDDLIFEGGEASTGWGSAAQALMAAQEQRWEEAMRRVHYLEHAHGEGLPALYAHGRICEARRQWECAQARYEEVQRRFGDFLAARTGAMRVAAYRFDAQAWEYQREALGRRREGHRYASLSWVDPFVAFGEPARAEGAEGAEGAGDVLDGDRDRFLAAWEELSQAQGMLDDGEWAQAQERCEGANQGSEQSLPAAQVICGRAAAQGGDPRRSRDYFMAAALSDDLTRGFYRRLQALAPRVLTGLGRADWALALTIPIRADDEASSKGEGGDGEFVRNREAARPAHFLPPRISEDDPGSDRAARALFVRGQTLLALGALGQCRETAKLLARAPGYGSKARYLEARSLLVAGELERAWRVLDGIEDDGLRAEALARWHLLQGQGAEALAALSDEVEVSPESLRVATLASLLDGRGREALRLVESAPDDVEHLALRPVRLRVLARTGQPIELEEELMYQAREGTTLEYLTDLGAAALWRRDFERAQQLLERALVLAPSDGEANWLMGLVLRVKGEDLQARRHFQRSHRGDEDSPWLLIELGQALLERGEVDRARAVFLRVTLREKQNIEAVEGLGRSYYLGDRRRGRRDLVEVLGKYRPLDKNAAARAEIYRWLAILYGSREGEEESLGYLLKAKEVIGERAELLVEEGLFYEARGEWEEARQAFSRALQINPILAQPHLGLSRAARAGGDVEAARRHLRRAADVAVDERWRQEAQEGLLSLSEEE